MGILDFTKSQGLGNDFIVIDNTEVNIDMPPNAIKALCDRHYGVGSDGLILVEPSTVADYFMNYFNADGSAAEMCGNGIRVCAKYIYQHIESRDTLMIETRAGVRAVELTVLDGSVESISVNMGKPQLEPRLIPVVTDLDRFIDEKFDVEGQVFRGTAVSMGNPHVVVFVDDLEQAPVSSVGPQIETLSLFPARANVEFVKVLGSDRLGVRVWERGVGETLACGTGACAAVVAAHV